MRELALHAPVKQVGRAKGRSSVAAAAYRAGASFYDERTGLMHDYTRKQGVEYSRTYAPDHAPEWVHDRERLWNAVEAKETKSNATVAHEWEIGFPAEFNAMQRREASHAVAQELMQRYQCAVDVHHHLPSRAGDERNFHAHIMFTTRGFDPSTKDGWAANKFRDLSQDKITVDGERTTRGKQELHDLRAFSTGVFNDIADRDGLDVRVEHLSFKARGIDREPTQHLGPTASDMERSGKRSDRGDRNCEIQAANDNLARLEGDAEIIDLEIEREKRRHQDSDDKRLFLAQHLEVFYGHRQATLDAELHALTHRIETQNFLQRVWGEITGKNGRVRDQMAGLEATVAEIQAERAANKAELHRLEQEQRQRTEQQEKEKQQKSDQEASNRAVMNRLEDNRRRLMDQVKVAPKPPQDVGRAGGNDNDPPVDPDLDGLLDDLGKSHDRDRDI